MSIRPFFERVVRKMFWTLLGYNVTNLCASPRNSTWFTRLFLLRPSTTNYHACQYLACCTCAHVITNTKLLTNSSIVVKKPPVHSLLWNGLPCQETSFKHQVRALLMKLHTNVRHISIPFVPLTLCAGRVLHFWQIPFWHNTPTFLARSCRLQTPWRGWLKWLAQVDPFICETRIKNLLPIVVVKLKSKTRLKWS